MQVIVRCWLIPSLLLRKMHMSQSLDSSENCLQKQNCRCNVIGTLTYDCSISFQTFSTAIRDLRSNLTREGEDKRAYSKRFTCSICFAKHASWQTPPAQPAHGILQYTTFELNLKMRRFVSVTTFHLELTVNINRNKRGCTHFRQ